MSGVWVNEGMVREEQGVWVEVGMGSKRERGGGCVMCWGVVQGVEVVL